MRERPPCHPLYFQATSGLQAAREVTVVIAGALEGGVEEALGTDYRVCSPDQFLSEPGTDLFQECVGVAVFPYHVWKLQRRRYNHFRCIPDLDPQLPLVTGMRF